MHRVAVIGAGIGAQHCAAFAELPELFEVTYICDLDAERGQALASVYNSRFCAGLETVLNDPLVDIIDVCLPPHLHVPVTLQALAAGKHVVCEKPLATSLSDVDRLEEAVARHDRQIFPVFQYRFGIGMDQMRALQDAELLEQCFAGSLETHWNRDAEYYAPAWRGTWAGEQGGAILGHAIHIHDLLTALIGPIDSVFAQMATRVNDIEVDDCAALTFRMANGAVITSSVTLGAANDQSRLRLMFKGATVESNHLPYAPAAEPWHVLARTPQDQPKIDTTLAQVRNDAPGYVGLFHEMSRALQGQANHAVTLADARRSIDLVTALYGSARGNASVKLPIAKDHPLYSGWTP